MGTRHVLLALGLGIAPMAVQAADEAAAPAAGTHTAVAPGRDRTVVTGEHYGAGAVHRWLWGADYRDVWTTPARVEVLDLQSFAGGLAPLMRVGGQETKGLAFRGADGRDYTFRAVDKDPTAILPAELRDTWARDLVQDQIAANQPASALVVDELMRAAGILRTEQRLVVMPDDPALGAFRKDFVGVVGQVYEFPRARSAENPGFEGAVEILKHDALYERLARDSRDRVDARAFLKARLLDIMVGDWDRHRDQWRWAKFEDTPGWQPIPDDRDQAFSRYDGLVMALSRARVPILQSYGEDYPSMKGLTWNGWEQDRELLAGLERSVWMEVSAELRSEITDDVIQRAARRMPAEYFQIDGPRLIRDLAARRDRLDEGASAFYEHLADKVKVYLSDASEDVEIRRLDGGDVRVEAWARAADGTRKAEPFYRRTLHENETEEVQIYTRGGTDRIVTVGRPRGIQVHVVGGSGQATVDDRRGGGTTLSDSGRGELQAGPGSRLDRRRTPRRPDRATPPGSLRGTGGATRSSPPGCPTAATPGPCWAPSWTRRASASARTPIPAATWSVPRGPSARARTGRTIAPISARRTAPGPGDGTRSPPASSPRGSSGSATRRPTPPAPRSSTRRRTGSSRSRPLSPCLCGGTCPSRRARPSSTPPASTPKTRR